MSVIEGGSSAELMGVGLEASAPGHATIKPLAYGIGGHYRVARRFTPAGTTLAGNLWTFRNPSASGLVMVIGRVSLRAVQIAAPTAAIEDRFNLKVARSYTVADATGSASIAPTAAMQEMRTSMASAVAQIREANVAAGASGGTKTLDTDAIATGSFWVAAAVPGAMQAPVPILDYYPSVADGQHPLLLAPDEGFIIANENNFGATSGIILHLEINWAETTVY